MFFARRPDDRTIRAILREPRELTGAGSPAGWNIDDNRTLIGVNCFPAACDALKAWKMFDLGWVQICWPSAPVAAGTVVAPLIRHLGFWSVNPARIIAVIDEPRRFGFTYATLEGHAECGQEQFLIEWLDNGEVWYSLYAVSRPGHWLAWLGYPFVRFLQGRFASDSMAAMRAYAQRTTDAPQNPSARHPPSTPAP